MRTFRNNHKRGRYRNNDRNFKRNGENLKFNSDFSSDSLFQRKSPGKNNHNAPKLIEKYNDLAREALSKGDKILSPFDNASLAKSLYFSINLGAL